MATFFSALWSRLSGWGYNPFWKCRWILQANWEYVCSWSCLHSSWTNHNLGHNFGPAFVLRTNTGISNHKFQRHPFFRSRCWCELLIYFGSVQRFSDVWLSLNLASSLKSVKLWLDGMVSWISLSWAKWASSPQKTELMQRHVGRVLLTCFRIHVPKAHDNLAESFLMCRL